MQALTRQLIACHLRDNSASLLCWWHCTDIPAIVPREWRSNGPVRLTPNWKKRLQTHLFKANNIIMLSGVSLHLLYGNVFCLVHGCGRAQWERKVCAHSMAPLTPKSLNGARGRPLSRYKYRRCSTITLLQERAKSPWINIHLPSAYTSSSCDISGVACDWYCGNFCLVCGVPALSIVITSFSSSLCTRSLTKVIVPPDY